MTPSIVPRTDVALDPEAVLALLDRPVAAWVGFRPTECRVLELKRTARRIVCRYELANGTHSAAVIGKWFSTERGELVASSLSALRECGFAGPLGVPGLIAYLPEMRALFVESVEGPLLTSLLKTDPRAAAAAGAWLAFFHKAPLEIPRACGPAKQRGSLERWAPQTPPLQDLVPRLDAALAALPDPGKLVHYDYYHAQMIVPSPGSVVTFDLDEAGMGDPAFDVAHFEAHLELKGLRLLGDPDAFSASASAFREGYTVVAPLPESHPGLAAFAWYKLAAQLVWWAAPPEHQRYAREALERSL